MLENGSLSASGMTATSAAVSILNWIGMSLTTNVTIQAFPEKDSIALKIKTDGSESRGQEEAACMRVFWPTRPLQ